MNKNDQGISTGTGGISILAIFVVLCLTTLATLSFVSARADYNLATKTAKSSQQFYAADALAEEKLADVMGAVRGNDWKTAVEALGCTVEPAQDKALILYDVPVNEIKTLYVVIEVQLDTEGMPTGEWARKSWYTQVVVTDDPAKGMNVWTAET